MKKYMSPVVHNYGTLSEAVQVGWRVNRDFARRRRIVI